MLEVVPVTAFKDNYVWTLRNATHAAVVDPGDARPVLDYLAREKLKLAAILATHHHRRPRRRHRRAAARNTACPSTGPKNEPIPTLTQPVSEGDTVTHPGARRRRSRCSTSRATRARTLPIMGQARCSAATRCSPAAAARVFEGTAEQMYASLDKLARAARRHQGVLRARVHARQHRLRQGRRARQRRARGARERATGACARPASPRCRARIGEEKATNPFLRCREPAVVESVNKYLGARVSDPVRVFAAIREWKNRS